MPPLLALDDVEVVVVVGVVVLPLVDDVDEVAAAAVMSSQRPSPTCVQTAACVTVESSVVSWSQVSNSPNGQIAVPQAQTSSAQPLRRRKPQFGIELVSTTTLGHIVVASQSWTPVFDSVPQPPPSTPPSVPPSTVDADDDDELESSPVDSCGTHAIANKSPVEVSITGMTG